MIPTTLYTHAAAALIAGALAAGGAWTVQGWRWGGRVEALKLEIAQDRERRTAAALTAESKTASDESTHARSTQENSDAFTTSAPVRDAIARADLARVERLRLDTERRAATYRAQAQANAVACGDLANRLEAFDRQLVEGVGVVAALRSDLGRRDGEVKLLRGQIDADRALLGEEK